MKRLQLLFLGLLSYVATNAQIVNNSVVTKNDAYMFAKSIVGDGDFDFYIGETNNVRLRDLNAGWATIPGEKNCWLVFVDEMPNGGWEHPCKYIYVKKKRDPMCTVISHEVVDAVRPPTDVILKPISKPNRYGAKAKMKPIVPKMQANSPNLAAGHTYAVILNGGMSQISNKERYWNDCSFVYKALRNVHGVPEQNIKVVMSDGTNSGADMNSEDGTYVSSPLDLDGDGQPDIEYAATKSNLLGSVLGSMAQKLTEDDHLLLFVTGHGGYDKTKKSSYIHMWNGEKLYPDELDACLNQVNAGFISIVMGQCNSGGFIEPLKRNNRIIITACKEDEYSFGSPNIPFDEFLYHWTSAISGRDAYGNNVEALTILPELSGWPNSVPTEKISILEAQTYAARKDLYANGGAQYASEKPQVNFFTNSVVSDLSFSYIPPQVELCFNNVRSNVTSTLETRDFGATYYHFNIGPVARVHIDPYRYRFWNSSCIWIRNDTDGMENRSTEPITIGDGDSEAKAYMYVKIRNRGVKPYNTGDATVTAFWAKSALALTESQWRGAYTGDGVKGGLFGSATITDVVQPGGTTIQRLTFAFFDAAFKTLKESNGAFCSLAFVRSAKEKNKFPVDTDYIAAAWATNKLAQNNVLASNAIYHHFLAVDLTNLKLNKTDFTVNIIPNDGLRRFFSDAVVSARLSPELMESWNNGGKAAEDVEQDKNEQNVFRLKSGNSKIKCLRMEPNASGTIGLKCNFIAAKDITTRKEYDIDVALMDNVTGKCYGGETFRIIQEPRPAIIPLVTTALQGSRAELIADNVSEAVEYKWYDADGKIVGSGPTFLVPVGKSASAYNLKVEAVSDGAINYATLQSSGYSSIKSVDSQSNPGAVSVSLTTPASEGAVLRIASASGSTPASDYRVGTGTMSYDIPAASLSSGIYQVSLIEEGKVTGAVKFTK